MATTLKYGQKGVKFFNVQCWQQQVLAEAATANQLRTGPNKSIPAGL
jgi:hypothetical protein